jgi:ferredoxin
LRVTVDNAVCQGHAQCHHICPEVFDIDDAGYSVLRTDVVPPGQEEAARDAELSCPERAIRIVD